MSGQCFLTLTIRMKSISNSLIKIGTKFVNIIDSGTLYVIYSKWMSVRQVSSHIFQRPNSPQTKWSKRKSISWLILHTLSFIAGFDFESFEVNNRSETDHTM